MSNNSYTERALVLARDLANARANLRGWHQTTDRAREQLEPMDEWQEYLRAQSGALEAKQFVTERETELRTLLVEAFNDTGAQAYGNGIGVKEWAVVKIIDRTLALEWIMQEARHLIKIDQRGLKAVAKFQIIPGVEEAREPRASIAKDLSQYESKEI